MRSLRERYISEYVTDLTVATLIPVGVMGLIGSLVYYLIDVRSVYIAGDTGMLKWISFHYIIACVLINRVRAFYGDSESAAPYALGLSLVMGLAVIYFSKGGETFVGDNLKLGGPFPILANLAIVALIWWTASRLTTECCVYGDEDWTIEQGLFSSAARHHRLKIEPEEEKKTFMDCLLRRKPLTDKEKLQPVRRHPGISIIYFSLVALPLFGLGQRLLPLDNETARGNCFLCMAVYVLCSLMLLVLTNLAGLKNFFYRKGILVPGGLGLFWLVLGGILILMVVSVAEWFPQPAPGTPGLYSQARRIPEAIESRLPVWNQSPIEGRRLSQETRDSGEVGSGASGMVGTRGGTVGKSQSGGQEESKGSQGTAKTSGGSGSAAKAPSVPPAPDMSGAGAILTMLGLAIIGLFALFVLLWLLVAVIGGIAGGLAGRKWSSAWLSAFFKRLADLFGKPLSSSKKKPPKKVKVYDRRELKTYGFKNPFRDPLLFEQLKPAELVEYTYDALMAYAADVGTPRKADQTPYEFLDDLPLSLSHLNKETQFLTELYVLAAYSPFAITDKHIAELKTVWRDLEYSLNKTFRT